MQDQKPIPVNAEEISTIKKVFADNDPLLKIMRAVAFGLKTTPAEKKELEKAFSDAELVKVVRRRFYPELSRDSEIGQVQDAWLGVESMVFGQHEGAIKQAMEYKRIALDMTMEALEAFVDPSKAVSSLDIKGYAGANDPLAIKLLARNQYIRHIESQILFLKIIAGTKEETEEEQKKRLNLDSNK